MKNLTSLGAAKLNASQPLNGNKDSRTCTKPYNLSQPLTRSPEKDTFGFKGGSGSKIFGSFAVDVTNTGDFMKAVQAEIASGKKVTKEGLKKRIPGIE